ncbi:phospholipid phosphatase 3 isoform X2 [Cimex lectularius]|uniref:Phosphatidic acid phosphatase type 2/haloperoxidase domain-containing protein n=1 Tax=Cimex lectularius TaxID=79782 RepID=A0A8I6RK69_CIMLE|nr:phospholipid phosphatase 3 isoform X2 [Cimex lectularius]
MRSSGGKRNCLSVFAVITVLVLIEYGVVPLLRPLGFMCGDPKLSHKFAGDTVSPKLLISVTAASPLVIVLLTEWWCSKSGPHRSWVKQSLIWYMDFLAGFLLLTTVIVICKCMVGEPRPHFLDTCQPKEAINCSQKFVTNFNCQNKNASQYFISDASKSFPSGHAAFSFYLFIFVAWFLQTRLHRVQPIVLIWLQTICFLWASFCALSRITDHRHHWWDVLAGALLGTFIGVCSVKSFCCGFRTEMNHSITTNKDGKSNEPMKFATVGERNVSTRWLLEKNSNYSTENVSSIM